jgi:hypothetical protein
MVSAGLFRGDRNQELAILPDVEPRADQRDDFVGAELRSV